MGRLPASQRHKRHDRRWKRDEKQRPGHQVQVDVKFVEPLPKAAATGVPDQGLQPAREVLPVHRDRRLHPPADLPAIRPEDRHRSS
jgi:hypothetical protein